MSETTHDASEQLFDRQVDEVANDAADTSKSTTEEKETSDLNLDDEQTQEGLELDTDKAPSKAEETRLKQIRKWQQAIDDGSKTLKELPKAQSWLKSYLTTAEAEPEVDHKAIAKEIAREAFREEREDIEFASLKETLNTMRLTKEQMESIKSKFRLFTSKGLSPFESLSMASEFARVDFTGISEKRRRMTIPQPSTKRPKGSVDMDNVPFNELKGNVSQEKINEHLRNLVKGR